MSMYCTVTTQFKSPVALASALVEVGGWTTDQIEIHETPQSLFGYKGDVRTQKANIIIRRKHVGSASNDIGFSLQEDSTYTAIISKFDKTKYGQSWINKLKQSCAFHAIKLQQEKKGRRVTREKLSNGKHLVTVQGYR